MVFDSLMARIGSARFTLHATPKPALAAVSKSQADAIMEVLKSNPKFIAKMKPHDRAELIGLLTKCNFCDTDLQTLLAMCEAPEVKKKSSRRPGQTFMPHLLHYFTEAEWVTLSKACTIAEGFDLLMRRILDLGGVNLSEKCKGWLVSLMLHLGNLGGSTEEAKTDLLAWFKGEYKRRGRKHPPVHPYLRDLPMPDKLKLAAPTLFQSVFGEETPVPDKLGLKFTQLPVVYCRTSVLRKPSVYLGQLSDQAEKPIQLLEKCIAIQQNTFQAIMQSSSSSQPNAGMALRDLVAPPVRHPLQGCMSRETIFGSQRTSSMEALPLTAPHLALMDRSPASPAASVVAASSHGSQSQSLDSQEMLLHVSDGVHRRADDLSSPAPLLLRKSQSQIFSCNLNHKEHATHQPGSAGTHSPINLFASGLPDPSVQQPPLGDLKVDFSKRPGMAAASAGVAEDLIADLEQPRSQKRSLPDKQGAQAVKPSDKELVAKPAVGRGRGRAGGRLKRGAAEAKAKTTGRKPKAIKTEAKWAHEASRHCFRVRFPNGTSRGFKYKKDDEADKKAKEQDAIKCADQHNGVM